jgi:hypothetical protein
MKLRTYWTKHRLLSGLVALSLAASHAGAVEPVCPPTKAAAPAEPKTVTIKATVEEPPAVTIKLGCRTAKAVPCRQCCDHTGGGGIDVQQPSDDKLVITMTGAAVAYGFPGKCTSAGWNFDLSQSFQIHTDDEKIKNVKLTIEARLIGVLRSNCKGGCASVSHATASVSCEGAGALVSLAMPGHSACGGDNVSINDHEGPVCQLVVPGCYTLHQALCLAAEAPRALLCKGPSAEFADGAIDPLWISAKEPFRGVAKKDFGFQVTIKVEPAEEPGNGARKEEPKNGEPKLEKIVPPKKDEDKKDEDKKEAAQPKELKEEFKIQHTP